MESEVKSPSESELYKLYPQLYEAIFKDKRNILISGIGGTGKTYSLQLIREECGKLGIKCDMTSTTGISAHAIKGTTIHRFSGIKLGKKPLNVILSDIKKRKEILKGWKEAQILIIDEVSMLGAKTLTLINQVAQYIRYGNRRMKIYNKKNRENIDEEHLSDEEIDKSSNDCKKDFPVLPFGGIQVIFSADFLQLPPVNDEFCFKSSVWEQLNLFNFRMIHPYRYTDHKHFQMLSRFRTGDFTEEDITILRTRIKAYNEYRQKERCGMINGIKPTRIYSLNRDVETVNLQELEKLDTDMIEYECTDTIIPKIKEKKGKNNDTKEEKTCNHFLITEYTEYLDNIADRNIYLKEGAQVMLTVNLDIELGLTNGSRGIVLACNDNSVTVKFMNDKTIDIIPYPYEYQDDNVLIIRQQFPLKLAWSYSIHKSQGATLDYAIIDLGTSLFCPALGYVALSRCRTLEGIYIVNIVPEFIKADPEALKFEQELIQNSIVANKIE
jgi:ATP-dependent DNA helicase PIF1